MLSAVRIFPLKIELSERLRRWMGSPGASCGSGREGADELLVRLRAAEPDAIDEAYRAHHAELRAFAQRLLGDRATAEDLVHDVFLVLPEALRGYRGEGSLRAFLIGVAANRCGRFVRGARRRRAALLSLQAEAARESARADDECARVELSQRVNRALDKLPLAQRTALILCEVEERTAAEASVILGVPEGTVRTRCFHARKRLQQLLGGLP